MQFHRVPANMPGVLIYVFMSFAALLRSGQARSGQAVPVAGETVRSARRQHKNEKRSVEGNLELGGRAATFMESIYGQARTAEIFQKIVAQAEDDSQASPAAAPKSSQPSLAAAQNGSQPSDPVVIVLDVEDEEEVIVLDVEDEEEDSNNQRKEHGSGIPYGFWRRFITEDLKSQYSDRKRMQLLRALRFYVQRKMGGACTPAAMRGMRDRHSCRSKGGALNSRKAAGLGFALLQWFVDHVQRLMSRADSCMLMNKARELRAELVHGGWPEADLPKLVGNAGHQWFRRWRLMYGIVRKVVGMKLKVSWRKVKRRIFVFLGNIFRLRAFWEICHPGTTMRFLSVDQKPSWFNNAGHTGTFARSGGSQPSVRENFAHTRQRYTILTSVPSWGHTDADVPPKVAVLFKGAPGGYIIRNLRTCRNLKSWMKVQTQEHGSYRSEDVVEALDWMLPSANSSEESIIVLLDWYQGHLTEEVAYLVRGKGHVLIFHGGGCTPFTQVNDTHLHAWLASLLIQIENEWALEERRRLIGMGQNKTPKMTREQILSIVQTAWLSIDHARVAQKGYKQTGPTMPLRGPVAPEDVFHDLLRVMEELDGSQPRPTEVSMTLRDQAVAFVRDGFEAGKWTTWSDCHKLIEEHDGAEEALAEGLEAFGYEGTDGSTDDEDDEDSSGLDDGDQDDADGGPGGPSAKAPAHHGSLVHGDVSGGEGADGFEGGGTGDPGLVHAVGVGLTDRSSADGDNKLKESNRPLAIAQARQLLYDEASKKRDDNMLRHLRKQMREETQEQKDASTEVGVLLRKRAQEQRAEDAKRQRDALEEERLAAKDLEATKVIRANAEQAAAEARLVALRQIILNRRDAEARKHAEVLARAQQRWLQTQYPVLLARRIIDTSRTLSKRAREAWEGDVRRLLKEGIFRRPLVVNDLWASDKTLTLEWAYTLPFNGGPRRQVRCGLPFQELVDVEAPKTMLGHDAVEVLLVLFSKCVPNARRLFDGAYRPARLLHVNDYVLDKAFVYGIVVLSKWMGVERFPQGVYGQWPPQFPEDLVPQSRSSGSADLGAPLGEDPLPPHLRQGSRAASSRCGPCP
jgi:hypothetical protein